MSSEKARNNALIEFDKQKVGFEAYFLSFVSFLAF